MVGAGIFTKGQNVRNTESAWPSGIKRIKGAVANFSPDKNTVTLEDGSKVFYEFLVVAAGLKLDWGAIEGLENALGKNGVTSNYHFDLAPCT